MLTRAQTEFAREFEAAAPALLAWANVRVRPELRRVLDPEDLIQEVGCRAFAQLQAHDPDQGSLRQWLFGFANRVLLEALRDLGRGPRRSRAERTDGSGLAEVVAAITSVTQRLARADTARVLQHRIEALPPEDRQLVVHRGLEQLPHAQVAELLGIAEPLLRKRWQRLCERLRTDPVLAPLAQP